MEAIRIPGVALARERLRRDPPQRRLPAAKLQLNALRKDLRFQKLVVEESISLRSRVFALGELVYPPLHEAVEQA
jgi:hypothetical protein